MIHDSDIFEISAKNVVTNFHNELCKKLHSHQVLSKDFKFLSEIDHVFESTKHYVVWDTHYKKNPTSIRKQPHENQNNANQNKD